MNLNYYASTDTTATSSNNGSFAGKIQEVILKRSTDSSFTSFTLVGSAQYAYYTGYAFTTSGSAGDLMTATVLDGNNSPVSHEYYRYYVSNSSPGYAGGLKYYVDDAGYRSAAATGVNLLTVANGTLSSYAHNYFEYLTDHSDGTHHWLDYYRYDDNGREILHVNPSGVTGYNSSSYADLVNFAGGTYLSASSAETQSCTTSTSCNFNVRPIPCKS